MSEIWGTPVVRYERHHWQDMRLQGWYMRDFSGEIWETLAVRYRSDEIWEGSKRDIWNSSDEVWEVQWWDMRNSNYEAREIHLCNIRDSCGKMWKTSLMGYETTLVVRFIRDSIYSSSVVIDPLVTCVSHMVGLFVTHESDLVRYVQYFNWWALYSQC